MRRIIRLDIPLKTSSSPCATVPHSVVMMVVVVAVMMMMMMMMISGDRYQAAAAGAGVKMPREGDGERGREGEREKKLVGGEVALCLFSPPMLPHT